MPPARQSRFRARVLSRRWRRCHHCSVTALCSGAAVRQVALHLLQALRFRQCRAPQCLRRLRKQKHGHQKSRNGRALVSLGRPIVWLRYQRKRESQNGNGGRRSGWQSGGVTAPVGSNVGTAYLEPNTIVMYEAAAIFRKISRLSKKGHTPAERRSAAWKEKGVGRSDRGSGKSETSPNTCNDSSLFEV